MFSHGQALIVLYRKRVNHGYPMTRESVTNYITSTHVSLSVCGKLRDSCLVVIEAVSYDSPGSNGSHTVKISDR